MDDISGTYEFPAYIKYSTIISLECHILLKYLSKFSLDIELDGAERLSEPEDDEDDFMDFNHDPINTDINVAVAVQGNISAHRVQE